MIGLRLSDGTITVVPIDQDGICADSFELKFDELNAISIECLEGYDDAPTLAVLYVAGKRTLQPRHGGGKKRERREKREEEGGKEGNEKHPFCTRMLPN